MGGGGGRAGDGEREVVRRRADGEPREGREHDGEQDGDRGGHGQDCAGGGGSRGLRGGGHEDHSSKTKDRSLTRSSVDPSVHRVKNGRSLYGGPVPRVSESHLAARRDQILDAATTRFAANGFQATGMADVIAASGLSAGAVYRYFRSKDELIAAIVERVVGEAAARFEVLLQQEPVPDPAAAVATAVRMVADVAGRGQVDLTRVAVQAWGEALRNPEVHAVVDRAYRTIRGFFVEVARRGQQAGTIPADADPLHLGATMLSAVLGFLLQRLLLGDLDPAAYTEALRVSWTGIPAAGG
nr:TetR/AcrR family transcriptional regulator [Geodermatophilus normandii]